MCESGRSGLVRGPGSGGSSATATFVPATLAAIADLKRQLIAHAGAGEDGGEPDWAEVLASAPISVRADRPDDAAPGPGVGRPLEGTGLAGWVTAKTVRRSSKLGIGRRARCTSEVEVDTLLGRTRVLRAAAGIGAGRVAAPELALAASAAA